MDRQSMAKDRLTEAEDELRQISRWMYDHPEVAYQEHESSARLAGFLETSGFTVRRPAYGLDTAFAARVVALGTADVVDAILAERVDHVLRAAGLLLEGADRAHAEARDVAARRRGAHRK